jgi:hypothetical protein
MRMLTGLAAALAASLALSVPALADNVIPDDLIVQSSECVGPDCVNNESFGVDTIRLKGPVLRFGFLDTSTAAGFPSNDWELTANDADGSGSESYFGFKDVTAGTTPLRILAGAPDDALRLEADGSARLRGGPVAQRVDGTTTESSTAADGPALVTALSGLPISSYEYVTDTANTRHIGPLAADFNAAFGLGDATNLASSDMAGVALAVGGELSKRVANLTGPQGVPGAQGDAGPKGDTGPAGPAAPTAAGFADTLARLAKLEKRSGYLEKHNTALKSKVARLAAKIRALRKR